MAEEKVFIIGATGGIGKQVAFQLSEKSIKTTLFVRDIGKAKSLFEGKPHLTFVKGDISDTNGYKAAIQGHTRLFLVTTSIASMGEDKERLAKIAFDSGVLQIVDVSSFTVAYNECGIISQAHTDGERLIRALARENKKRSYVALRGGAFMTNHLWGDQYSIKSASCLFASSSPLTKTAWVDPRDIGDVAACVLSDPIEKHSNYVYPIHPDVKTNEERAKIFTKVLGKEIKYQQIDQVKHYEQILDHVKIHRQAYDIVALGSRDGDVWPTPEISILTKRPIRTLEEWVVDNKSSFL